jgi:uncharacterized YceG family protein
VVRGTLVALAVAALVAGCGGASAAPPTTTIKQLRQFRILFPEGFTRAEMAARVTAVAKIAKQESHHPVKLSEKKYLSASLRQAFPGFGAKKLQMEGFLFPDTYFFDKTSTSAYLVQEQLSEFRTMWKKVDMSYARSKNLTPYDVLKIASIIEGEAQASNEYPLVSAVIYNRLHLGMTLGMDSTLRYGLHVPGNQSLTQSELANPTPYNTRLHKGLPPTPIGNPGLLALQAAAHPAHVDYLYFVRKPDHVHHYFTASYQDFLNHEAEYGY